MKRLAVLTVGMTHSGKSTFAKRLADALGNAIVIDPDHHAAFLNTHYRRLLPEDGPNTLKNSLTAFIVDYAKRQSTAHLIASNANLTAETRSHLMRTIYPASEFTRILVHFDLLKNLLWKRVRASEKSIDIFRSAVFFEEVLHRQLHQTEQGAATDPLPEEADFLFVIKTPGDNEGVIQQIAELAAVTDESIEDESS